MQANLKDDDIEEGEIRDEAQSPTQRHTYHNPTMIMYHMMTLTYTINDPFFTTWNFGGGPRTAEEAYYRVLG